MPKDEIIKEVGTMLRGLYYEDLEFFYQLISKYTGKVNHK